MNPPNEKKISSAEIRAKHKEFLFPCVANYYEEPIVLIKGQGCCVADADGREYLDFFGGILTLGLGHCHPEVTAAVQDQLEVLGHTSTLYPTEPIVAVAEQLARITPGKLKKSFFTTSGTEADETAILLAKIFTGRDEIIALRHGYSGRSLNALSLRDQAQQAAAKLPNNDPLRKQLMALAASEDAIRGKLVATKEGGAITGEERLREYLGGLYGDVNGYDGRPTDSQAARTVSLGRELDDVVKQFTDTTNKQLGAVNRGLAGKKLPPIKILSETDWQKQQDAGSGGGGGMQSYSATHSAGRSSAKQDADPFERD